MIGDSDKDIKAAEAAKIKTKILFKEDNKSENAFKNNAKIIKALTEAIQFL
jgi:histidinol phosphatase-like enzyme